MSTSGTESGPYLPPGLPAPCPATDGLDTAYWEATKQHQLVVQRCTECQTFRWGPEWICYHCHSFAFDWIHVAGSGRIYSWQRSWHPVHPALAGAQPYLVVLVELPDANHIRMIGNLTGDPMQEVVIGSDVRAVYEDHPDEGITLVQWRVISQG